MIMEDSIKAWPYLEPGVQVEPKPEVEDAPNECAQETPEAESPPREPISYDHWFQEAD